MSLLLDDAHRTVFREPSTVDTSSNVPKERWHLAVATTAFIVYVLVARWLMYTRGFEIGDALTKTSAAQHVIASRDPHLAAMGFYWMPLPQLSQLLFVLVLQQVGYAQFAGPLTSACWGAGVVLVLAAVGRAAGAPRWLRIGLTVAYAFSPVAIWSSANGMSEASSFFFLALTLLGYTRWVQRRNPAALAVMAVALGGLMLCRYEALPVAAGMAVCCALQTKRDKWVSTAVLVMLPTLYMFGLWLFASQLIMKDAFFWLKTLIRIGKASGTGASIYASNPTVVDMVRFGLLMTIVISLLLLVLLPSVLSRRWHRFLRNVGFAVPGLVFPAIVFIQQFRGTAPGQTRYYYPAWIVGVVVAFDVAQRLEQRADTRRITILRPLAWAGLGAVAVASLASQVIGLSSARVATVESEHLLFAPLIGRESPAADAATLRDKSAGWKLLFAVTDGELARGAHLMLDTDTSPDGPLFTRHADQLVIPEDRDFEQTLAAPEGRVEYVAVRVSAIGSSSRYLPSMMAIVDSTTKGTWTKIAEYGTAPNFMIALYRATP